jgi:hypothetical protein
VRGAGTVSEDLVFGLYQRKSPPSSFSPGKTLPSTRAVDIPKMGDLSSLAPPQNLRKGV